MLSSLKFMDCIFFLTKSLGLSEECATGWGLCDFLQSTLLHGYFVDIIG